MLFDNAIIEMTMLMRASRMIRLNEIKNEYIRDDVKGV